MKNSGWKTQHHWYLCDHIGFPVFWAAVGVLEGEQNPKGAQSKADQGHPMPRAACETPCLLVALGNLQSTVAKRRSILLFLLRKRQRSLCRGLVSAHTSRRVSQLSWSWAGRATPWGWACLAGGLVCSRGKTCTGTDWERGLEARINAGVAPVSG